MSLTFNSVATKLGLGPEHEAWRATFSQTDPTDDLDAIRKRLARGVIRASRWLEFPDDIAAALVLAANDLSKSPELVRLLWHCHHRLFINRCDLDEILAWRPLPANCTWRPMFYALVVLSGFPVVRRLHEDRRISYDISRRTLADIVIWMRVHQQLYGEIGLEEIWWPSTYFTGRLFALGRLQFEMASFDLPFHAFRRRDSRDIVAMPSAGERFGLNGQFADADRQSRDRADAWTATLSINEREIVGHPVDAHGHVQQSTLTLSRDDWEPAIRPKDPILAVHIPASGPLDRTACVDAFQQAITFFPRHFPEHRVTGFATSSWLLDAQLADYLPASSNIVKFSRLFHLLPQPGATEAQTKQRVFGFGKLPQTIDEFPQNTSLQRIVAAHMKSGERWRMGAGFILPFEIEQFT